MAFRQPPQPPFCKKGLLDGSFSIVSTNTPTANATQQGLICDSGQRATAVPIAHQRVAEDCLADTLDREAFDLCRSGQGCGFRTEARKRLNRGACPGSKLRTALRRRCGVRDPEPPATAG